jgi:hypothetical protein
LLCPLSGFSYHLFDTFSANLVVANIAAATAPADAVAFLIFNIARGQSVTLLQMLADLNALTSQSIEPKFAAGLWGKCVSRLRTSVRLRLHSVTSPK